MKIIYCLQGIFNSGGMERCLAIKSNWLVKHGYEVIILTTEQKGRLPFFDFDSRVRHIDLGINYWDNIKRPFLCKLFFFFKNSFLHRKLLNEILRKERADIVVSMFAHEMAFLNSIRDGSKKILEYHFTKRRYEENKRTGIVGIFDKFYSRQTLNTIKKFDKFIVLTQHDKLLWGGTNIVNIPNPVPMPKNINASKKKKVLGVGRLVYEKGFDRLIEIWERFYTAHPDWSLEIVGDGILKDTFQDIIRKKKLDKCIIISPATLNIYHKLSEASILAMTSRHEGFGMVLIEAQSCGVPVISYDCPSGPAEIIHHGIDGFLINDGDIDTFVEKLELLVLDEELRKEMGENAQKNSLQYSEDCIMPQWVSLFKELSVSKMD